MNLLKIGFALVFCVGMSPLHAGDGPTTNSIHDGTRLIDIVGTAGIGATVLTCTIFDGDLTVAKEKEVIVGGVSGKSVLATGYHSMNDYSKLLYIEVRIREKIFSQSGVSVWLSPEMEIIKQYNFDWSDQKVNGATVHTKDFLNQSTLPCFPTDHSVSTGMGGDYENDGWLDAGVRMYLHYDFNVTGAAKPYEINGTGTAQPRGRIPSSKKPASVSSEVYCFEGTKEGIKRRWKVEIEEERILFYLFECSKGNVFLYTSYIKGENPSGEEVLESRIRMLDGTTGEVKYSCLLDVKSGFELVMSSMYCDEKSEDLYWAANYISLTVKPSKKNEGETNSYFVVGKIATDGKCISKIIDNSWTASETGAKNLSAPLLFVRSMGMTRSGEFVLAGIHAYWTGDCFATIGETPIMTFCSGGMQVMYFSPTFERTELQQLIVPVSGLNDPTFTALDCRLQRVVYNYDLGSTEAHWNPKTETMTVLQARIATGLSKQKVLIYAVSLKKGENKEVDELGELGEAVPWPGFILDDHQVAIRLNRYSLEVEYRKF